MPVTDANDGKPATGQHDMAVGKVQVTKAPVLGPVLQQTAASQPSMQQLQPVFRTAAALSLHNEHRRHARAATDLASEASDCTAASQQNTHDLHGATQHTDTQGCKGAPNAAGVGGTSYSAAHSSERAATQASDAAAPQVNSCQAVTSASTAATVNQGPAAPACSGLPPAGLTKSGMHSRPQPEVSGLSSRPGGTRVAGTGQNNENDPQAITMARAVPGKAQVPAAAKPCKPMSSSKVCCQSP